MSVWCEGFRVKHHRVNSVQCKNGYPAEVFSCQKPLTGTENQPVGSKAVATAPVSQEGYPSLF
ncbi:hypothetical protein AD14_3774 [Escherichia coli 3-073-06_S4_C2]|nr:hypothetical protein AD14_3774 [Escherichia coli 3-073-06_S4_C2]